MTEVTLAIREDLPRRAIDGPVTTTAVALTAGRLLEIAEWSSVGRQLGRLGNSALWWIGDWMNLGEKTYGSTYSEGQAITGLASGTLANLASVARSVEASRRREDLSFAHHVEVAPLEGWQQERWLAQAVERGLTSKQLRDALKGDRTIPRSLSVSRIVFTAAPERAQVWQEAAADSGLEFDDWAAKVLDAASMLPQPEWAAGIEA